jgi:hypothetical protein
MYAAHLSDLVVRQATEVTQRGDLGLPLVDPHELLERVTQCDQLAPPLGRNMRFIKLHWMFAETAFRGELLAGMVDEDLPHASRGDREEVSSVSDIEVGARESQIDL